MILLRYQCRPSATSIVKYLVWRHYPVFRGNLCQYRLLRENGVMPSLTERRSVGSKKKSILACGDRCFLGVGGGRGDFGSTGYKNDPSIVKRRLEGMHCNVVDRKTELECTDRCEDGKYSCASNHQKPL